MPSGVKEFQGGKGRAASAFNKISESFQQLKQIGPDIGGALAQIFGLVLDTGIAAYRNAQNKLAQRAQQKAAQQREKAAQQREQELLDREASVAAREKALKNTKPAAGDSRVEPEQIVASAADFENLKAGKDKNGQQAETIDVSDDIIDADFRDITPESASRDVVIAGMHNRGRRGAGGMRADHAAGAAQSNAPVSLPGRPAKLLPPPPKGKDIK